MDPRNRIDKKCNLPQDEIITLTEIVGLQKELVLTIKPCDKGAGLVILDFEVYMRACYHHLLSKEPNQPNQLEEGNSYYKKKMILL